MQKETAQRLCKLAAQKTGHTVYVDQSISYHTHTFTPHSKMTYRVTYFWSENDCEGVNFKTWTEAQSFLKRLALEGLTFQLLLPKENSNV